MKTTALFGGAIAASYALLLLASPPAAAQTQNYPAKAIRVVVPFPPGGFSDVFGRILAGKMHESWGQPAVVENRPGAGGNIGADIVAKSEPDGHTLLVSPPGPIAINQSLYPKLPYDASKWVPVTVLAAVPNVLAVTCYLSSVLLLFVNHY